MQFSVRALMVAVLLVAVAAVSISTDVVPIAALPPILWVACVAVGVFFARGRTLRCILFAAIGGILGGVLAAGSIGFFDQMSFTTWYSPLMVIAMGGLGGAFLGCAVRVIMEGLTLGLNRRATKNH